MVKHSYDVIVIGAGAAGLMTAIQAGKRGRKTLLIEHTSKIGEKIRISGGGRCNFTNFGASYENYLSENPHFMKSALANYSQHDFIKMVQSYHIDYHEKTLGQLFCDGSSRQIIAMLLDQCQQVGVDIRLNCSVLELAKNEDIFLLRTSQGELTSQSVVVATGGLSIPQMGATDFGYRIARQFDLQIVATRPALVPLWVSGNEKIHCAQLSGVAVPSIVSYKKEKVASSQKIMSHEGKNIHFKENILFTHKGLSGPAILQISSYLPSFDHQRISLNLLQSINLIDYFKSNKQSKQTPAQLLKMHLPNRLVDALATSDYHERIVDLSLAKLMVISEQVHQFSLVITGSEGYAKAEVTAGGVDTNELSSKTMESRKVKGLYFVGEVVDVTGWLGGYNFQWAWSSGFAAGSYC